MLREGAEQKISSSYTRNTEKTVDIVRGVCYSVDVVAECGKGGGQSRSGGRSRVLSESAVYQSQNRKIKKRRHEKAKMFKNDME